MIWLVDIFRKKDVSEYDSTFYKIDRKSGSIRVSKLTKDNSADFNILANLILNTSLDEKPSQIVIEKTGLGMGLYDAMIDIFNKSNLVIMKENGELFYK